MTPSQAAEKEPHKLLLVEGEDDRRVFNALVQYLSIKDMVIDSYNGKHNLGNDLSERTRSSNFHIFSSLGIIRDADASASSAFSSVTDSLLKANLPVPPLPMQAAGVYGIRVSVLIIPPSSDQGELEDLCLSSLEGRPAMECVDTYLGCISESGPPVAQVRLAKAKLHTYLAAGPVLFTQTNPERRRRPGLRIGEAADAGV